MLSYAARILESLEVAGGCNLLVHTLLLIVVLATLALVLAGLAGGYGLVQLLLVVGVIWFIRWLVAGCRRGCWLLMLSLVLCRVRVAGNAASCL